MLALMMRLTIAGIITVFPSLISLRIIVYSIFSNVHLSVGTTKIVTTNSQNMFPPLNRLGYGDMLRTRHGLLSLPSFYTCFCVRALNNVGCAVLSRNANRRRIFSLNFWVNYSHTKKRQTVSRRTSRAGCHRENVYHILIAEVPLLFCCCWTSVHYAVLRIFRKVLGGTYVIILRYSSSTPASKHIYIVYFRTFSHSHSHILVCFVQMRIISSCQSVY